MTTPTIKPPIFQNIPQELQTVPNWVNWRYHEDPSKPKPSKMPLNPNGLKAAKQNDPITWGTYATVCGNIWNRPELGIGFELGTPDRPTGFICVDLDHVLTDGKITDPAALDIFETLDSYTEITPGGDGLHIWIKAAITEDRRKRKGIIEIYGTGRYLTVTGDRYGNRETIEERTAEIKEIIEKYLTDPAADPQQPQEPAPVFSPVGTSNAAPQTQPGALDWNDTIQDDYDPWDAAGTPVTTWDGTGDSDNDVIQKMTNRDSKAAALWRGDISGNGNDHSAADQALINKLVYWTNGDAAQVDRLFRQSGLMRPKWDVKHSQGKTYGQMTIEKAMTGFIPRTAAAGNAAPNQQTGTGPTAAGTSQSVGPNQSTQGAAPNQSGGTVPGTGSPQPQQPQGQQPPQVEDVYLFSAAQWRTDFEDMILVKTPRISTGFPYLNQLLDGGLYPSLITLGAVTSTGKTTLGLQIMDNIAAAGKDVIIFSLEMSRFELIAKSISRLSFKEAPRKSDAFTTRQLLDYDSYNQYSTERLLLIEKSKQRYFDEIAPHVFIREALGTMDVDKMREILAAHVNQTGTAPVVLVDYIQLMAPPRKITRNLTDKQVIDNNVMSLKQISRDFNTPVIGISSLNRAAYSTRGNNQKQTQGQTPQMKNADNKVTLTDFKESGAIEYSSDVLLGLNCDLYNDRTKTGVMSLDILKNRNGEKGTSQHFDYYYKFNCFMEKMSPTAPTVI